MNEQIWNSSKNEPKNDSNVDANVQNAILGQLSILETVPFKKSKELWNSDGSVEQVLIQMNDQVLNSSKTNESNVQKAILNKNPLLYQLFLQILKNLTVNIWIRDLLDVNIVKKDSLNHKLQRNMKEFILEKSHSVVKFAITKVMILAILGSMGKKSMG